MDIHGDIIEPGAFGTNLHDIPMYRDHDREKMLGGWRSFVQEGEKLKVEGAILLKNSNGDPRPVAVNTYSLMKSGFLTGISVGFRPKPGGVIFDEEKNIRRIKKAWLLEASIVSMPAQPKARIRSVKSMTGDGLCDWLEECGFGADEITILMTKGFDALLKQEVAVPRFLPKRDAEQSGDQLALGATLVEEMRGLLKVVSMEGRSDAR